MFASEGREHVEGMHPGTPFHMLALPIHKKPTMQKCDCEGYLYVRLEERTEEGSMFEQNYYALRSKELKQFATPEDCHFHFSRRKAPALLVKAKFDVVFFKEWRDMASPTLIGFKLELSQEIEGTVVNSEAVFVCTSRAEYDVWADFLVAAVGSSASIFETTLGVAGLGLTIRSNITGLDVGASTRLICKAMEKNIKPGFLVCAVNGIDVSASSFAETKKVLSRASRPVVLLLANLPAVDGKDAVEAAVVVHSLPECEDKVVMSMFDEGAPDDFGIQLGTLDGKSITVFRWAEMASAEYQLMSKEGKWEPVNDWIAEQQYKHYGEIVVEGLWTKQEGRSMRTRYISMREAHIYVFANAQARLEEDTEPEGPFRIVRQQEWSSRSWPHATGLVMYNDKTGDGMDWNVGFANEQEKKYWMGHINTQINRFENGIEQDVLARNGVPKKGFVRPAYYSKKKIDSLGSSTFMSSNSLRKLGAGKGEGEKNAAKEARQKTNEAVAKNALRKGDARVIITMKDGGVTVLEGDLYKHGGQISRRLKVAQGWAVCGKPPKAQPVVFAAPQTIDIYEEEIDGACDPTHLFEKQGVFFGANDPDYSASILQVTSKAKNLAKSGRLQPGHMILQVNELWTGSSSFEETCFIISEVYRTTGKNVTLTLMAPTVGGNKEVLKVFPLEDPTGLLPNELGLLVKEKGIQAVQVETGRNICFWAFCMLAQIKHIERSDDDFMELLIFDIIGWGSVVVETAGHEGHGEWVVDLEQAIEVAQQDCSKLCCVEQEKLAKWRSEREKKLEEEAAEEEKKAAGAEGEAKGGKKGKKGKKGK